MIYPLLPLFLNLVLGAGTAFVGLVEGIAESTSSILNLVSGRLSDKVRKRLGIIWQIYSAALAFSIDAILSIVAAWLLVIFIPATTKES